MADKPKKKWIQGATSSAHGQFRKKAEAAGKSTKAFAEEKKDAGGTVGKQANLALNLMGASGADKSKERRKRIYNHAASQRAMKE